MVREFPMQITIYEGGPMTNLALAISIEPQFPNWPRTRFHGRKLQSCRPMMPSS